ncbi:MAG: FAD-binding oxidoreductase [Gemmataceae bacterium]
MNCHTLIVGQGIAGTALAWQLRWRGVAVAAIDRGEPATASRVAAGLMTPVTGQRLAKTWRLDDLWPAAVAHYRRAEAETGERFFLPGPSVRLFQSADERAAFEAKAGGFGEWVRPPNPPVNPDDLAAPFGGFEMPTAGRLLTGRYLDASRRSLSVTTADLAPTDLDLSGDGVRVPRLGLTAGRVVFCRGVGDAASPWFADVRFHPAKGEILTVRIPGLAETRVVHHGVWLVPLGDDLFRVGATFDRDNLDTLPTDAGREEVLAKLRAFVRRPVEVVEHQAAVRPVISAGRPTLLRHPADSRLWLFNGLGSKGSSLAPYFAARLAETLTHESPPVATGGL